MAAPGMNYGGKGKKMTPGQMGEGKYTDQPGGASPASKRPISTGKVSGKKLTPKQMGK